MVEEKGLKSEAADRIGDYVKLNGGTELVEKLSADQELMKNKNVKEALEDMKLLLKYLDLFDVSDKVCAFINDINHVHLLMILTKACTFIKWCKNITYQTTQENAG